jgi:hypothetical protein
MSTPMIVTLCSCLCSDAGCSSGFRRIDSPSRTTVGQCVDLDVRSVEAIHRVFLARDRLYCSSCQCSAMVFFSWAWGPGDVCLRDVGCCSRVPCRELYLHYNQLSGSMPLTLGSLTALR